MSIPPTKATASNETKPQGDSECGSTESKYDKYKSPEFCGSAYSKLLSPDKVAASELFGTVFEVTDSLSVAFPDHSSREELVSKILVETGSTRKEVENLSNMIGDPTYSFVASFMNASAFCNCIQDGCIARLKLMDQEALQAASGAPTGTESESIRAEKGIEAEGNIDSETIKAKAEEDDAGPA